MIMPATRLILWKRSPGAFSPAPPLLRGEVTPAPVVKQRLGPDA
jgi:hypothetical protein